VSAPLAVFRADASAAIGGGHVARCLALAAALADAGWRCALAARPGTVETVPAAAALPLIRLPEGAVADDPAALAATLPEGCDLLVIDHYGWTEAEERAARRIARRIACLDDFAARRHDADLVLDPTPGREAGAYRGLVAPGCMVLAGAAWAPLGQRFRAARDAALEARAGRPPGRLLVALGMTDPANATLRVLEGIREARFEGAVDVVLGAAAPHRAAVAAALPPGARLHLDPPDIPALITAADLAIGAGGVAALERACLGLPSLLVEVAGNQRAAIAGLVAAGAARTLGPLGTLSAGAVADALDTCLADTAGLTAMAKAAALLCDGLGAARAAIALAPERARDGARVWLRPATAADSDVLLEWQSEPGARAHFRTPSVPSRAEHEAWMAATLSDPRRLLHVLSRDGEAAGYVRLDRHRGHDAYEVSILVAAAFRDRGVASAGLRCARRLVGASPLTAHVLPANSPSRRAFAAAGFAEEGDGQTWSCPPWSAEARHDA